MYRKNPVISAVALAAVVAMVLCVCLAPVSAAALSRKLLPNSEFRDGGAGWELGEYGMVDGKVTREGYPSIKLSVTKAKTPVDARVSHLLCFLMAELPLHTYSSEVSEGDMESKVVENTRENVIIVY